MYKCIQTQSHRYQECGHTERASYAMSLIHFVAISLIYSVDRLHYYYQNNIDEQKEKKKKKVDSGNIKNRMEPEWDWKIFAIAKKKKINL